MGASLTSECLTFTNGVKLLSTGNDTTAKFYLSALAAYVPYNVNTPLRTGGVPEVYGWDYTITDTYTYRSYDSKYRINGTATLPSTGKYIYSIDWNDTTNIDTESITKYGIYTPSDDQTSGSIAGGTQVTSSGYGTRSSQTVTLRTCLIYIRVA